MLSQADKKNVIIPKQLQDARFRFVKLLPKSKKPFEDNWTATANYTYDEIKEWVAEGNNYGVLCGNGLVVVDTDTEEMEKKLAPLLLPTFTVKTRKGYHRYYFVDGVKSTKVPGLDIQASGKQVVGPNSIHPSGVVYRVVRDYPIRLVSKKEFGEALFEAGVVRTSKSEPEDMDELLQPKSEGSRNDAAFKIANFFHRAGQDKSMVFEGLRAWNARNTPPLPEVELNTIVNSVFSKEPYKVFYRQNPSIAAESATNTDAAKEVLALLLTDKRKGYRRIAELACQTLNLKTIIESEPRPTSYWWSNGRYTTGAEGEFYKFVYNLVGEAVSRAGLGEIWQYARAMSYIHEKEMDANPQLLSVKNGVLNVLTGELHPHNPNYLIRTQLGTEYDPNAKCPRWDKFLNEVVVPKGGEATPELQAKINTLQETAGYCLWRENPLHKAVMLTGGGANGKSVFLETITAMLGSDNVSTVPLQAFDTKEYSLSAMVGKLANIHSDLSASALKGSGNFKMIVSGDEVYVNAKYKDAISARIYAKQLFSANKIPESSDGTAAFYRRWIIIDFPNTFEEEKADKQLAKKLKEELPGILNWAIAGLKRLLENEHFSYQPNIHEMEKIYNVLSDPVYAFTEEMLEWDGDSVVPKHEMYSAYLKFVKEQKLPVMLDNAFAKRLRLVLPNIQTQRRSVGFEKKVMCWVGYKIEGRLEVKPPEGGNIVNIDI